MSRCNFAIQRLIPPGTNDPPIHPRIGILHVDASNSNGEQLYRYFRDRSGGIESHFHVERAGNPYQFRDTDWEADANYKANPFAISIETQGFGEGWWTKEQIETIKRLILWCHDVHGIPFREVTSWNDPMGGWGYHTLFGSPSNWTPVAKSCPGPNRKIQFHKIIVPWLKEQEDMSFSIKDRKLLEEVHEQNKIIIEKLNKSNRKGRRANKKLRRILDWIRGGQP